MLDRLRALFARMDRGLILVILLSLVAAWPFLFRASLPRETDAELHVFRAAELGYSLRALELYPRWAPDFYYGYGYPIFNYYAPLTYYLANLFSLALPGGAVFGSKAVFIVTFLMAGTGTYLLTRLYARSRAGIIAASSYLFAPYIYIIDPHLRGDLAEFLALGVAPVALWAAASFQQHPTRARLFAASLGLAALILSHNLLGLAFFGLLAGQWLCLVLVSRTKLRTALVHALPLILAVGIAAFFWLPVALESNAVQLHNLVGPGHFDFREHFLQPQELFGASLPLDLGSVNPEFRFNLGLAQWILALLGAVGLIVPVRRSGAFESFTSRAGAFWLMSSLILLALMLQFSLPLWEAIPIMSFFQFPWRLLGPAALCLAVLGGYCTFLVPIQSHRLQTGILVVAVAAPLISALPVWSPPAWATFGAIDQAAMLDFELGGFALGTTSTGDFVPSTVDVVPSPVPSVVDSYRNGEPLDRVEPSRIPNDATITLKEQRPTLELYQTQSNEAFTLQLYRFMFPGWMATIDGEPVELRHTEPDGFILIPVPAGEHEVRIWFGLTPSRVIATGISIISLIALVLIAYSQKSEPIQHNDKLTKQDWQAVAGALSLILIIAFAGSFVGIWQPVSTGLIAIPADSSTHHYFEGGVDLIGFNLNSTSLQPGDELPLTLYWKAREPIPANYQVFVHLTTVPEHIWGQSDKLNPGDYPTTRWPLDKYLRDPHSFTIPLGTPPGTYEIRVGLWNRSSGLRQLILEEDGTVLGDALVLPTTITIERASQQPSIDELPLDVISETEIADGIILLGADLDPNGPFTSQLGHLAIRLYWMSNRGDLPNYRIALRLLAAGSQVVAETEEDITDGLFPTDQWEPDMVIKDIHTIWFDESIPAGTYTIELRLISNDTTPSDWQKLTKITRQ